MLSEILRPLYARHCALGRRVIASTHILGFPPLFQIAPKQGGNRYRLLRPRSLHNKGGPKGGGPMDMGVGIWRWELKPSEMLQIMKHRPHLFASGARIASEHPWRHWECSRSIYQIVENWCYFFPLFFFSEIFEKIKHFKNFNWKLSIGNVDFQKKKIGRKKSLVFFLVGHWHLLSVCSMQ